jgi:hypothetical protein
MLSGLRTEMPFQSRDCTQVQLNKKNKETKTFMKPLHFCTAMAVAFSQRPGMRAKSVTVALTMT